MSRTPPDSSAPLDQQADDTASLRAEIERLQHLVASQQQQIADLAALNVILRRAAATQHKTVRKIGEGKGRAIHVLTPREREILVLVAKGLTSERIAKALDISYHTVTHHRHNLLRKLKLGNAADLIRLAISENLIQG